MIKSGLKDLKQEIKEISKEGKESEKPDKILDNAEGILNRLPISLAQLQVKLKNETRQFLFSLYRSKNMTKQVYNKKFKNTKLNRYL